MEVIIMLLIISFLFVCLENLWFWLTVVYIDSYFVYIYSQSVVNMAAEGGIWQVKLKSIIRLNLNLWLTQCNGDTKGYTSPIRSITLNLTTLSSVVIHSPF